MNRTEIIKFPLSGKITSKNYFKKLCEESLIEKIDQNNILTYQHLIGL